MGEIFGMLITIRGKTTFSGSVMFYSRNSKFWCYLILVEISEGFLASFSQARQTASALRQVVRVRRLLKKEEVAKELHSIAQLTHHKTSYMLGHLLLAA